MQYTKESSRNPNSNTLEPDRPRHDLPASRVIAQQYSYSTLVSLRFNFLKKNFGALKYIIIYCFIAVLKFPKSGSVSTDSVVT